MRRVVDAYEGRGYHCIGAHPMNLDVTHLAFDRPDEEPVDVYVQPYAKSGNDVLAVAVFQVRRLVN